EHFAPTGHRVEIVGVCAACRERHATVTGTCLSPGPALSDTVRTRISCKVEFGASHVTGTESAASDAARRAEVGHDAVFAERPPRVADAPPVPDQEPREAAPLLARNEPLQVARDIHRVVLARKAAPLPVP